MSIFDPGTVMQAVTVTSSGTFVAVGYSNSNYPAFAYSADGSTWTTPALMNGSTSFDQINSIAANSSGLCVAIGNDSSLVPLYAVGAF
jgi:hypothetical protein